jgi:hypothetical protein
VPKLISGPWHDSKCSGIIKIGNGELKYYGVDIDSRGTEFVFDGSDFNPAASSLVPVQSVVGVARYPARRHHFALDVPVFSAHMYTLLQEI